MYKIVFYNFKLKFNNFNLKLLKFTLLLFVANTIPIYKFRALNDVNGKKMAKKHEINIEKLKSTILSMASMFETGRIRKMKDITTMYPTGMVWALGINFGGYMTKCANPEKFLFSDIIKLANLLSIDVGLITSVILKEAQQNVKPKDLSDILPINPPDPG